MYHLNTEMKQPFDLSRLRAAGFKLGFVDDARRMATPHVVECHVLDEDRLGQQRYSQELDDRRVWIKEHCDSLHEIEPIRDQVFRLTGRRYRFSDPDTAFWFKIRFG